MIRSANATLVVLFFSLQILSPMPRLAVAQDDPAASWNRWLVPAWYEGFVVRGQDPDEVFEPTQPSDTLRGRRGPSQPAETADELFEIDPGFTSITGERLATDAVSDDASSENLGSQEATVTAPTDIVGLLQESNNVQTVKSQRRSPIAMDPYVHGYRHGQIYANSDGAYMFPVRRDLDTMLSAIDPSLIADVVVLPGPYGLRYGPGFSFINVITVDTPRYCNGFESHYRTGFDVRTNGGGIFGRQTAYGGNSDWGFVFNYGIRKSSDYAPGGNSEWSRIPSGYSRQNIYAQFGKDLSPTTKIEARYQRLDGTNIEFPTQFFDVNYQGTDAFVFSLIQEDDCNCDSFRVDTWFNFTRFSGDTLSPGKRLPYPVIDKVEYALDDYANVGHLPGSARSSLDGFTWGDANSTGIRAVKTYGEKGMQQVRLGADFRFITQKLNERFLLGDRNPIGSTLYVDPYVSTNMPRAEMIDPGLFSELVLPVTSFFTVSVGSRIDFVHTSARESQYRRNTSVVGVREDLHQNDNLYAFYLKGELDISPTWSISGGGGYAERPPSLVDRYADGVFLGIMQSGFNRVIGTPTLRKEKAWQVDLGVRADYDWLALRGNVFYSWIDDYNLYQGEILNDPFGARLIRATNAELATLWGFHLRGESDLTERLRAFANISYLEGRDRDIRVATAPGLVDQPLFGIVPLESRAGLIWVDPCGGQRWGLESGLRIVNGQDDVARLRRGSTTVLELTPLEFTTPGFWTAYIRGYYNVRQNINFIAGIENLFDRSYQEHLDLRLPNNPNITNPNDPRSVFTKVLAPGISPYLGIECTY